MEFGRETPLLLDCGVALGPFTLAYLTYGTLNADRSNAILVCHALTGDQYAAGVHPVTGKPGWWSLMIGPGLPLDTDRFFVICVNVGSEEHTSELQSLMRISYDVCCLKK